jgi:hypothetical protein
MRSTLGCVMTFRPRLRDRAPRRPRGSLGGLRRWGSCEVATIERRTDERAPHALSLERRDAVEASAECARFDGLAWSLSEPVESSRARGIGGSYAESTADRGAGAKGLGSPRSVGGKRVARASVRRRVCRAHGREPRAGGRRGFRCSGEHSEASVDAVESPAAPVMVHAAKRSSRRAPSIEVVSSFGCFGHDLVRRGGVRRPRLSQPTPARRSRSPNDHDA